jgi:hypothetical protein
MLLRFALRAEPPFFGPFGVVSGMAVPAAAAIGAGDAGIRTRRFDTMAELVLTTPPEVEFISTSTAINPFVEFDLMPFLRGTAVFDSLTTGETATFNPGIAAGVLPVVVCFDAAAANAATTASGTRCRLLNASAALAGAGALTLRSTAVIVSGIGEPGGESSNERTGESGGESIPRPDNP